MKLIASSSNPPLGALITVQHLKDKVKLEWGDATSFTSDEGTTFQSEITICRYLARKFPQYKVYGSDILEMCAIDQWLLTFSIAGSCEIQELLTKLDAHLQLRGRGSQAYWIGRNCTIADYCLWGFLFDNRDKWKDSSFDSVKQYFKMIESLSTVKNTLNILPGSKSTPRNEKATKKPGKATGAPENSLEAMRKEDGKFEDLPGTEMGKVVVRFPPEASGYLHIGHAKAALLNQYYKEAFQGKLIMRFDDTNPAKEKVDFEQVILGDLEQLKITPDKFTYTSDYFDIMLDFCEKMLKEGTAYVDDTSPEDMKSEREQKVESKNRNNSVEKNVSMWNEMKNGTEVGLNCCVRAKIDMQSLNGCMRDPTIYRCKSEAHPRTGNKYKVYPTYDFACPIVDSIEGVTHCLRTMEYRDRNAQFYWFIDVLGLRKPYIWEYSRLNMTNTVLSKRKLTWFVDNNIVQGWDDPRMPTVRGILRRGLTVEGLKQFVVAQGSSRSVVVMEWDKIWAFNKKVIDPVAPRYTAVESNSAVPVLIKSAVEQATTAAKHPKNPDVGEKTVWTAPRVLIDQEDAKELSVGNNVTFINWGNIKIDEIVKDSTGNVTEVKATPNLDDKDFRKTLKLTWLADTKQAPTIPCCCVYFNHIISKPVLGKDEDFKQYIDHETQVEVMMLGDPELASVKKSEIIQLQRKGFFICDSPYQPASIHSGKPSPIILFHIPDGHAKEIPHFKPKAPKIDGKVESPKISGGDADCISENIKNQGEKVRTLKLQKADKGTIDAQVKVLLSLKEAYKKITGTDWKPQPVSEKTNVNIQTSSGDEINSKIIQQGDLVRKLKSEKADKAAVDAEVKVLLSLKEEYKKATGTGWQPQPVKQEAKTSNNASDIDSKITEQGNKVRNLKLQKAEKATIDAEVKVLLSLKEEYKKLFGKDWEPQPEPQKRAEEKTSNSSETELNSKIIQQGDKVRKLKSEKAGKATIDAEVKVLLSLKGEYKKITGKDWKPQPESQNKPVESINNSSETELNSKISLQGDKVRKLKLEKADKATIDAEVKVLLSLKEEYKKLSGKDWKPQPEPQKKVEGKACNSSETELNSKITQQGDKIRKLKSEKADKQTIDVEVKVLLSLKEEYKKVSGTDWKPQPQQKANDEKATRVSSAAASDNSGSKINQDNKVGDISSKIIEQGNTVRNLKSQNADKETINDAVKSLLSLKEEYKSLTGQDYPREDQSKGDGKSGKGENKNKGDKQAQIKQKPSPKEKKADSAAEGLKKVTRLGLEAKKEENLPEWYSQVITKGELIEYYDVSGCYVLRPWSFAIWEAIRDWFDGHIKKLGVKNCYFPMFVSRSVLEKEKTHIADFAPEVAWVTKSGSSDLAEPIAIRPTSETVMYPAYAKWIQSHRDLPIRLNQWNNVVRWEFKHPQPFLRTREFLWQEGHTAFATQEEAEAEVTVILDLYAKVYTDLLAVPVVKGRKTEKEKFAGGDYTLTTEAFISASGRAIQGATSHHLGQNFSKMFEIDFEDPETREKKYVYQNSWGITTRTIGVLIMVHADNQGLVLPPRVASIQAIIVACGIPASFPENEKEKLYKFCTDLEKKLVDADVKASSDLRDNYSAGWKFNHWELKGVPLRIEVGPKDLKSNQIVAVRRDTGSKHTIKNDSSLVDEIKKVLDDIQSSLLARAQNELDSHIKLCKEWSNFCSLLDEKNLLLSPFCGEITCEDNIKKHSAREDPAGDSGAPAMGAKGLCIPFSQPQDILPSDKCIYHECKNKPKYYTLFGRSY